MTAKRRTSAETERLVDSLIEGKRLQAAEIEALQTQVRKLTASFTLTISTLDRIAGALETMSNQLVALDDASFDQHAEQALGVVADDTASVDRIH